MNLKRLLQQDRIRPHKTSQQEISGLIKLVERDIKDARIKEVSIDRRFATAYNAALQLATILLLCSGYRTEGKGHHATVFLTMKDILGKEYYALADYFDSCRAKRNITDYEQAGQISLAEAEELAHEAEKFLHIAISWLRKNHPVYL